jgi:hypothetical protein
MRLHAFGRGTGTGDTAFMRLHAFSRGTGTGDTALSFLRDLKGRKCHDLVARLSDARWIEQGTAKPAHDRHTRASRYSVGRLRVVVSTQNFGCPHLRRGTRRIATKVIRITHRQLPACLHLPRKYGSRRGLTA